MRIWFVRHGLSTANADFKVYSQQSDHTIPLLPEGKAQARSVGEFLSKEMLSRLSRLEEGHREFSHEPLRVRIWRSPYLRARQTTQEILNVLNRSGEFEVDQRENIALREQSFGVWTGMQTEDRLREWPRESAFYDQLVQSGGRFWAPIPCGESQAQVASRVQTVFGAIHHDREHHGIHDVIIVSHGIAIQCAIMQWMRYTFEWIHEHPHVNNCEVRLINGKRYEGTVFPGFSATPVPDL